MPTNDKNEVKSPRMTNKANKSRHEKEQKTIKWLKIGGIAVIAVIILILVIGAVYEYVYLPNKTLATVEDQNISVTQFQEGVRFQRSNLISNYNYMAQLYQSFGMAMDETTRNSYESQLSEAYAPILGQQVYSSMVNQLVLDYGAKDAGISVSDEEVAKELQSMWSYFPEGTSTPAPTSEPFANTPTVSEEQKALLNYTETPTITSTVQLEDNLSSLESSGVLEGPIASATPEATLTATAPAESPTPTLDFSPTPSLTPTTYSEEMYQENLEGQFAGNTYYSKDFFEKQIYYQLLQGKVEDSLKENIGTEADMVWARHILVATEDEAKAVIERLNNGEEWNEIAAEVSTDTSNNITGGDLGWFMKGAMVEPFETAAFAQEVGTYSQEPVQSDFGYHIIQIVGHEVRPLTSAEQDSAVTNAYNAWLEEAKAKLNVKTGTDWMDYVPTDPQLSAF